MKSTFSVSTIVAVIGAAMTANYAHAAETPEHSFTGKVGLFTEYEYRGISQSSESPAGQLNLDYANKNGLYLGTFLSNIKWLKDSARENGFSSSSTVEWDIYGGFKWLF